MDKAVKASLFMYALWVILGIICCCYPVTLLAGLLLFASLHIGIIIGLLILSTESELED